MSAMILIRANVSRFLAMVACSGMLAACAVTATADSDLFANRKANAFDAATIDAIGDKVADWQLANLDDLSYVRNFTDDFHDQRGWIQGALFVGMMHWASLPGNEEYDAVLREIAESNEWRLGDRLFHGDDHVVGQLYLHFYEQDRDPAMLDHTIGQFTEILVANPDDTLEFLGDWVPGFGMVCQLRWCWCDALFMSPPTWIGLSLATGDDRYMEYGDREFWATTDYLLDPEFNLFYRDSRFFTMRDEEGNKIFWARGNGWVYAGLVNILRMLPKDHPSYPRYMQLYRDMSETIASIQHDNGLWRVSLLAKEKYPSPETSGSSFLTYGLAWGVSNGHLDAEVYGPTVSRAWQALVNAVGDDGKLGWVQPVGSAPDSVFETDSHLYGVGAFLLAASQVMQTRPYIAAAAEEESRKILLMDFDNSTSGDPEHKLLEHEKLALAPAAGVNGSTGLRAEYEGSEIGSERIVKRLLLPEVGVEYSLNYDVRFDEEFQFVKGGKLHGLGPMDPVTGGRPIIPEGWSARVMFREGGVPELYVYHQDMQGMYGDHGVVENPFVFEKGRYHSVSLQVRVNDPPEAANGFARLYIDGTLIERMEGLRLRGSPGEESLISKFLFSSFHGGHEPEWAPKKKDGSFATVYATFDNISIESP